METPTVSRRRLLEIGGSGVAAGLAGCVGRSVGEEWDGAVRINEDAYTHFELRATGPATLSYAVEVLDGPRIDIALLRDRERLDFVFRSDWVAHEAGSRWRVRRAAVEGIPLPAGEWALVLDNSERGRARPPGGYHNDSALVAVRYRLAAR